MSDMETCRHCGAKNLKWVRTVTIYGGVVPMLLNCLDQRHSCLNDRTHAARDGGNPSKVIGRRDTEKPVYGERNPIAPEDDHYWDNVRYQMMQQTPSKMPEWAKPAEEKETHMDFTLIHCNQTNYVALEVKFDGNKPYFYKAESSDNFRAGDHVVVMVDGSLKIASVTAVHTNPIAHLESGRAYNWVVQKINMSKYAARSEMQNRMIEQLKVWEAQRRIMEAAEAQTRMIAGLPGAEAALSDFKRLGSTVVEINL